MKIAFDAIPLVNKSMSGIGWSEAGQTMAMVDLYPNNEYQYVYFAGRRAEEKRERIEKFSRGKVMLNISGFSGMLYRAIINFLPIPYSFFFGKDRDITHFFNYIIPPFVKGKKVVTVYDMVYKAFPETMRTRTKFMLNMGLRRSMRRADLIVTISEFSRDEIVKYFPEYESKIRVVPCGVDLNVFKPCTDTNEITRVAREYSIDGEYFLYLGTLEPRKNIERMIDGYKLFLDQLENKDRVPKLVIAGGRGWLFDSIYAKVNELKLDKQVIFTEYLASEDRMPLMSGALAFVFPSLYEGFGMPPLEAMACGTPVLTSNVASLPEVVGDCAVLCDPYSIESISEGFGKLYSDEKLRENLSVRGLSRAGEFTWERSAKILYEAYEELLR